MKMQTITVTAAPKPVDPVIAALALLGFRVKRKTKSTFTCRLAPGKYIPSFPAFFSSLNDELRRKVDRSDSLFLPPSFNAVYCVSKATIGSITYILDIGVGGIYLDMKDSNRKAK